MIFSKQLKTTYRIRRNRVYDSCRTETAGTLSAVRFQSDTPALSDTRFDVLLDGDSIFVDPDTRPLMAEGEYVVFDAALNVSVTEGQLLEFVAQPTGPASGVGYALYTTIKIDDNN